MLKSCSTAGGLEDRLTGSLIDNAKKTRLTTYRVYQSSNRYASFSREYPQLLSRSMSDLTGPANGCMLDSRLLWISGKKCPKQAAPVGTGECATQTLDAR